MTDWCVDLRGRVGALELQIELSSSARPVVLVGPNGSGKTSLLRAIAGARLPLSGRIELDSEVLQDSAADVRRPPEARRVGYVPQGYALFPHLSVRGNVAFGAGRDPDAAERIDAALERFGLRAMQAALPSTLSGGQQQRVALARAVASRPRGLLLDEPMAALDPESRRDMRRLLAELVGASGLPAIVVTHDVRDVRALGGEVVVLEGGRIAQRGAADALAAAPKTAFVSELFGV